MFRTAAASAVRAAGRRVATAAPLRWASAEAGPQGGVAAGGTSKLDESIASTRKALAEAAGLSGERSKPIVAGKCRLGQMLLAKGETEAATKEFRDALAIQEEVEPDSEALATSCYMIGHVLVSLKETDEALSLFRKSASIRESLGNTDPTDLSKLYFILGQLLVMREEFDEASAIFAKVFAIAESQHAEGERLQLADLYCRVAAHFHSKKQSVKALELYNKALPLREELSPDTEETAVLHYSIAQAHAASVREEPNNEVKKEGQLAAISSCYKALGILQTLKPGSLEVASMQNVLGQLYHIQGLYTHALEFQERSLEIQEKTPDAPPLDIANTLNYLGLLYEQLGREKDAAAARARMKSIVETAQAEHARLRAERGEEVKEAQ